ncbi:glutaminase family protein [Flavobacterium lacustre]|uniref:glutaminase family protein n=1 Tax=Flavobacterium lacustre TaxID=3016339 RepID=UPI0022B6BD19|nr:glutaminase family protein [Flavobacterium lacustre]
MKIITKFNILIIAIVLIISNKSNAQELRAPAYPLVTHTPYQSIWSVGNELNGTATQHWTGTDHSLTGLVKVDGKIYRFLGNQSINYKTVLPTTDEEEYTAKYSELAPADNWFTSDFNDSSWKSGQAPFTDDDSQAKTSWKSKNLWFRRTFDLKDKNLKSLFLKLRHDDNIHVYLNGEKIYDVSGWKHQYKFIEIEKAVIKKLKSKNNVLAIHIENTAGGQWLDAGLVTEDLSMKNIEILKANQTKVTLEATSTKYTFDCGKTQLKVTFTSPLLLDDLKLLSRPVTYVSVVVSANDNKKHNVQLYFGASSALAVDSPGQKVEAWKYNQDNLSILKAGTAEQPILQKKGDDLRIDWGYAYVAIPSSKNAKQYISSSNKSLEPFLSNKAVPNSSNKKGTNLLMNTIIDIGTVDNKEIEQLFMLGYDELYAVNYFGTNLKPWWKKDGNTIEGEFYQAHKEYKKIMQRCNDFDAQLKLDATKAGGKKYADLCVLAYREAIAAHSITEAPNGDILFLSKENNSNGSVNTVDLTYPSAPLFLLYNPKLMEGMLNGIFYYSESGKWKKPFPAHDLGTYPIATGQTYGEDMPVEEAGNAIIVVAAIAQQEGNANYAKKHWATLTEWATYLRKSGFDPENQLSTDDFAGHLARNANLSAKAIEALAAYGKLAGILGDKKTEREYIAEAKEMALKWMELAKDNDHYTLAFEKPGTWSQKYNLAWDTILDLNVFPSTIRKTEIAYYLTKQNKYGLPLDSRENYTKSDWIMWTATLTDNQEDFDAIVDPIWKYANETNSRVPLSDWHETLDGNMVGFKARSVVAGYYLQLLKWKTENKK